ncbi:hydroxyacid dehydrogenase [Methanofollis aquaemaris]|uniref:Hydroxyacid dehydrogenase n=1 Tax=Methanofollis aquaemaris TaxID=126734 RepID=A0A8A3S7U1_9EURY|nr:hydroxyacid dehydrogenase [Methanofollis aquaemaris]
MPGPIEGSSEFLLYQTEGGETRVQVRLFEGTVWLTQRLISELYQKSVKTINEHIKNIYEEGELDPQATIRKFRIVQQEGDRRVERLVDFYNLDMILAVGYRVRSHRGTQFRQWATKQLREYVVKGFVLDDERLKEAGGIGADYFDELLERIRDIRASERRFYQKITDIYATSVDYDSKHPMTIEFFKTVQNKMHWAIHGHTAAETIFLRADGSKPHMGLTTWKSGPGGRIQKADVGVAKNYLTEEEISNLNLIVNQYLDFAEFQARQRREMRMEDWIKKLDGFLRLNDRKVLRNAGKVSAEKAKRKAQQEFERYEAQRRIREASEPTSDFDLMVDEVRYLSEGRGEDEH